MPNTPDPWSGLVPGGRDSRRVDSAGRWNFFWSITADRHPALVLRIAVLPESRQDPPRLRSLDLRIERYPSPTLVLVLRDRAQKAIFEVLCRDIIAAAQEAADEAAAASRFVARTARWHHLLRGGGSGMSAERQKGLIAEIELLLALARASGPKAALTAWGGPFGAQKDFDDGRSCIEVKSIRSAATPRVRISSEHQLADVANRNLLLAVVPVDAVAPPEGRDLHAHITRATDALGVRCTAQMDLWEQALAASGYEAEDEALRAFAWKAGSFRYFKIDGAFPRLLSPLPPGILDLSYSIDLSTCLACECVAPFQPADEKRSSQ